MKPKKKTKEISICFASSSGGHYEELLKLLPLMQKYNSFIVTEKTNYQINNLNIKTYYLKQINRKELKCILNLFINTVKSLYIFIKEKPDYMITTGVLSVIPMALITKLFRKKLIYIESFAKITSSTLTGKLLYKFANRFYVQWEEMLKVYPKAIYKGGLY